MAEPVDAQCINKLTDVVRVIQQGAARLEIRRADTRPVRRKHTKAVVPRPLMQKLSFKTAAGHTMAKYHRVASGVAQVGEGQGAPVLEGQALVIEGCLAGGVFHYGFHCQ
jgi:hypothetical protein